MTKKETVIVVTEKVIEEAARILYEEEMGKGSYSEAPEGAKVESRRWAKIMLLKLAVVSAS